MDEYKSIQDPSSEDTWQIMLKQARKNTKLYEEAFPGLIPTNKITMLSQMTDLVGGEEEEDDLTMPLNIKRKKKNSLIHSDTMGVDLLAMREKEAVAKGKKRGEIAPIVDEKKLRHEKR